ncbi:sulfotransferase family protein [Devosia salina]|uniref:Sulfotransferase n=1 Tax=Devosia salina TaxID=2860336 RepID=A0ABX8W8F9_9HYPH|nr:sulfotransferase [Devosia salina]QYO75088.1 sulfotransferase [Devosia salina]
MTKPNTFIIGAPKCGTTALAHYLSERDDVFLSYPKEPFFLASDFPALLQRHGLGEMDDYLKLYSGADPEIHKVIIDASTNYLMSECAIKNALKLNPDAKFIALLRNPVDVAHAFHMEQLFAHNEDVNDFEEAWELQDARKAGRSIPNGCFEPKFLIYKEVVDFFPQVTRFFELVPEDRRLIILQEEMVVNMSSAYERVLAFLNLPSDGRSDFERQNASHAHRFPALAHLVLEPPELIAPAIEKVRTYLRRGRYAPVEKLKRWLNVPATRAPMSGEFRESLWRELKPTVMELSRVVPEVEVWLK